MKVKVILLASSLLVAQIATAQMMGTGNRLHPSTPSTGSGSNSGGMTGGPGGMTGGAMNGFGAMGGAMGSILTVGTDGVAYTLRSKAGTSQTPSLEVVAIRPSGTIAWATSVDAGMTHVALSGALLLVANGNGGMGLTGATTGGGTTGSSTASQQLVALSTASGSVQWTLPLDGVAMDLEPFSGGTYVFLAKGNATSIGGGMNGGTTGTAAMNRSVLAIDNNGHVIWTLGLD